MDEPIVVKYHFNQNDYRAYKRVFDTTQSRLSWDQAEYIILACLVIGAALSDYVNDQKNQLTLYVLVYVLLINPIRYRFGIRASLRRMPNWEVEYQFFRDKILASHTNVRVEYGWKYFSLAIAAPTGILLSDGLSANVWVPKRAIASDVEFEKLAQLAKENIKKFKDLR
jgi:hypothetical protein